MCSCSPTRWPMVKFRAALRLSLLHALLCRVIYTGIWLERTRPSRGSENAARVANNDLIASKFDPTRCPGYTNRMKRRAESIAYNVCLPIVKIPTSSLVSIDFAATMLSSRIQIRGINESNFLSFQVWIEYYIILKIQLYTRVTIKVNESYIRFRD